MHTDHQLSVNATAINDPRCGGDSNLESIFVNALSTAMDDELRGALTWQIKERRAVGLQVLESRSETNLDSEQDRTRTEQGYVRQGAQRPKRQCGSIAESMARRGTVAHIGVSLSTLALPQPSPDRA